MRGGARAGACGSGAPSWGVLLRRRHLAGAPENRGCGAAGWDRAVRDLEGGRDLSGKLPFPEDRGFPPGTPLAGRMRPRSLDQVVGQETLVGGGGGFGRWAGAGGCPPSASGGPP